MEKLQYSPIDVLCPDFVLGSVLPHRVLHLDHRVVVRIGDGDPTEDRSCEFRVLNDSEIYAYFRSTIFCLSLGPFDGALKNASALWSYLLEFTLTTTILFTYTLSIYYSFYYLSLFSRTFSSMLQVLSVMGSPITSTDQEWDFPTLREKIVIERKKRRKRERERYLVCSGLNNDIHRPGAELDYIDNLKKRKKER